MSTANNYTSTLSPDMVSAINTNNWTLTYLSICLTCSIWQITNSLNLTWIARKPVHGVVLFQSFISFLSILFSLLNPLTRLNCDARYWVSIVTVNLGGICIQSVLLYKAYVCNERARWLLGIGALAQCGYMVLIFLDATAGRVTSTQDPLTGMCQLENKNWPALAKIGVDLLSNAILSFAFFRVIFRQYRVFGNSLYKSLLSNSIIFSIGVILSNLIVGILIATRVIGSLSSDLYAFDWVVTSYLLIKQFRRDHHQPKATRNSYDLPGFNYRINDDLQVTSLPVISYNAQLARTPTCSHCEKCQHRLRSDDSLPTSSFYPGS
ncbi:hypothetical protein INT43_001664 [Umbelopsis isabellina]|uniref:Uncharacterized protein n=1 Tax=Mortierella isabellina TaxID=91625 RepID=A0A8H7PRF2_MORIS|nr:hypothetical protein INT43_001664 [Umbelopsis isabellina]